MSDNTKPFAFRAPRDLAIAIKVSAAKCEQPIQGWLLDAAKMRLEQERESANEQVA